MTFQQILSDLKKNKFHPIYFLHGSEAYFIDLISDYIENNVLNEGEKAFNQTIRHGRDTIVERGKQGGKYEKPIDFQTVYNDLSRLPMMAPKQVVILKEAQDFRDLKK